MDGGGFGAKIGVKKLTTWADGYSAPTEQTPFLKESLSAAFERINDDSLVGSSSRGPGAQGVLKCTGDTEHNLDYNNFDSYFECVAGAVASRVFTITDDDLPKFMLLEIEKVIQRHRFYAAKLGGVTISGRAGGIVQAKFKWHPRLRNVSATAFPAISTPGPRNLVLFKHLVFWIGDQAGALNSGDALGIDSFELTFDRQLKADDNDTTSPTYILEPIPGDWRVGSLKLTFPRYNAATSILATWKDADTPLQAQFLFTGSGETFKIELPELRIATGFDVPVEGPGPIKFDGELSMHPSTSGNPMYVGNEVRFTFT